MTDATAGDALSPKRSRKPMLFGLVGAVVFGAGGFFLTYSGMLALPSGHDSGHFEAAPLPDVGFVSLEPLTVSLGPASTSKHLRFSAQIEAGTSYLEEVRAMSPRIIDVLNSYLRAIDPAHLEDPTMLPMIKAQMLRRVQIVTGEGRVQDLLIAEFVLN